MKVCTVKFGFFVSKKNVSRRLVVTAAAEGVSDFNFGKCAMISNMKKIEISPGCKTTILAMRKDEKRKDKILGSRMKSNEVEEFKRRGREKRKIRSYL